MLSLRKSLNSRHPQSLFTHKIKVIYFIFLLVITNYRIYGWLPSGNRQITTLMVPLWITTMLCCLLKWQNQKARIVYLSVAKLMRLTIYKWSLHFSKEAVVLNARSARMCQLNMTSDEDRTQSDITDKSKWRTQQNTASCSPFSRKGAVAHCVHI